MRKIANSNELQTSLRHILARAQEPNPSRVEISSELRKLAKALTASGWANMPQSANEYDDIPNSQFGKWTPATKKELTEVLEHAIKRVKRKDPKAVDDIVDVRTARELGDMIRDIPYNFAHPSESDKSNYQRPPSNTLKSVLFGVSATAEINRLAFDVFKKVWPEAWKKMSQFIKLPY